jgi:hypothetical protein
MRGFLHSVWFAVCWFLAGLADLIDPPDNRGELPRTARFTNGTWRPTWRVIGKPPESLRFFEWMAGDLDDE